VSLGYENPFSNSKKVNPEGMILVFRKYRIINQKPDSEGVALP